MSDPAGGAFEALLGAAVAAAGNPAVADEARTRIRAALRTYGDALADILLRDLAADPRPLLDRHAEAYTELAAAVRAAGTNAVVQG